MHRVPLPKRVIDVIGRFVGVQPMWLSGKYGTTIPNRSPLLVAIGTPIMVPHNPDPDHETIQGILDQFITQMQELFQTFKAEAGTPDLQLEVI